MVDVPKAPEKAAVYAHHVDPSSTLLPMLIGGLVMIVLAMALVVAFG